MSDVVLRGKIYQAVVRPVLPRNSSNVMALAESPSISILAAAPPVLVGRPKSFYIPSLDGIRAIAFLIVFLAHAGLKWVIPGGFGVTVFFFLSGYLITSLLRLENVRNGTISLPKFYLRRLLRIAPPLYLILAMVVLLVQVGALPDHLTGAGLRAQILQLTNYYGISHGTNGIAQGTIVFWSLAVEEHFYLVFPVLYLLFVKYLPSRNRQAAVLAAICLAVLIWRCILRFHFHADTLRTYFATDTRVDSILLGCIMAIWCNPMFEDHISFRLLKIAKYLVPTAAVLLLASFAIRSDDFRESFRYTLQGVALGPLFLAAIANSGSPVVRFLNSSALKWTGVLSYSLYLSHRVIIQLVSSRLAAGPWLGGSIALVLSLLFSTMMYLSVEKPLAGLRKKLSV